MSQVFRSGSALLLSNHNGKVSEVSIDKIQTVFEILRANPKISLQTLEGLLSQIPKVRIVHTMVTKDRKSSISVLIIFFKKKHFALENSLDLTLSLDSQENYRMSREKGGKVS